MRAAKVKTQQTKTLKHLTKKSFFSSVSAAKDEGSAVTPRIFTQIHCLVGVILQKNKSLFFMSLNMFGSNTAVTLKRLNWKPLN